MTSFILIDQECSITQQKCRIKRDALYKKCGFKIANDFELRHTWMVETCNIHSIELWSQCSGGDANKNKFTLPPPLNVKTYYGTMAVIALNGKGDIISINNEKWKKIYEHLTGDIESEELQSDDDEDDVSFSAKEKAFVDDDSCDDADENDYDDDENEDDNGIVHQNSVESEFDEDELLTQLQCGSELEEEPYDYSDAE